MATIKSLHSNFNFSSRLHNCGAVFIATPSDLLSYYPALPRISYTSTRLRCQLLVVMGGLDDVFGIQKRNSMRGKARRPTPIRLFIYLFNSRKNKGATPKGYVPKQREHKETRQEPNSSDLHGCAVRKSRGQEYPHTVRNTARKSAPNKLTYPSLFPSSPRFPRHPLIHSRGISGFLVCPVLHSPSYPRQLKETDKTPVPPGVG